MDVAVSQVRVNARRVVGLQFAIAVLAAVAYGIADSGWQALSALFGGAISISVSLLLRRGVLKATEIARSDPKKSMMVLYFGALQRFVLVLALFGLGLGLFGLGPLAMIIGFGATQVAYAVAMRLSAKPARRR